MTTWDGVLASQQRRAEFARLGFPLRLITTATAKHLAPAGFGRTAVVMPADEGTAAGTPTPHRSTGSHHNIAAGEQS